MTTASRKATAFSLIIRMVVVPCFVVVGEPGRSAEGGERGDRPGLSIIYTVARNFQSLKRLKIIHQRNRKRQSPGAFRGREGDPERGGGCLGVGSSRRGHQFRGGRAVAASLSLRVRQEGRTVTGKEGQAGGELASPSGRQAGNTAVLAHVADDASFRNRAEMERRPRTASLEWPSGIPRPPFQMRKHQF